MSATLDQLALAHYRMLGRIDAADAENRRATRASYRAFRAGDHDRADRERESAERASNSAHRRLLAADRIMDAMSRGAARCACGRGPVADGYSVCERCAWIPGGER